MENSTKKKPYFKSVVKGVLGHPLPLEVKMSIAITYFLLVFAGDTVAGIVVTFVVLLFCVSNEDFKCGYTKIKDMKICSFNKILLSKLSEWISSKQIQINVKNIKIIIARNRFLLRK
jgi:hypothetical protein